MSAEGRPDQADSTLAEALKVLDRLNIPWAITGSIAMAAQGHIRHTQDADVKILVGVLEEYEEALTLEMRRSWFSRIDEHTFEGAHGFIIEFYPVQDRLDAQTFRRRIRMDLLPEYGEKAWTVTPEDLILLKLREHKRWGSMIQIEDVRMLLAVRRKDLDVDYLKSQVRRHQLMIEWEKATMQDGQGAK